MSKLKSIPAFKTEAEEQKFWETHDSTDYIDWSKAERARLPNLKPSRKPEALDHGDLHSAAAGLAGANQDRRQRARRAVPIADQDVVGGKGAMNGRRTLSPYLTATMKIRGNRSSTLPSACGK